MKKFKDYPLTECAEACDKLIKNGATIYQKWTCDKCGDRVTANNPNVFTILCHHEDCGHTTDIAKKGCNYILFASGKAAIDVLDDIGGKR